MRQISQRIIFAVIGGALIWEGIRSGLSGNLYATALFIIGCYIAYRSRFWR